MESGSTVGGSTADVVVVGGGTVGAWCAYFLRRSGAGRVVLIDRSTLGQGASSRAAGIVRSQGGTPTAVHLAEWSRAFYLSQHDELGIDSGFVRQGYFIPAFTDADVETARSRMAMQQGLGLAVRWIDADEADRLNPTMTPGVTRGGTFFDEDGYIHPPRNVLAYTVALSTSGVEVYEGVSFDGLVVSGDRVTGVETSVGRIATGAVVLTGGPQLATVGQAAGTAIPAGGVRHQVAVSEPHASLDPARLPMVFDLAAGLYWRPEEGGLLFGMSNPDEAPGEATEIDWPYLEQMQARLAELVPVTASLRLRKVWAATIDYTPDHLPILGPVLRDGQPVSGTTVASAGGHGMMWGPGVARAAADLALTGTTDVVDATFLGLDRFDEHGRSRLAPDPIALPFPERTTRT
ncbi:MAG TPA: FAD-binding oxidoreductase [Acidimicrobiales bacterium]